MIHCNEMQQFRCVYLSAYMFVSENMHSRSIDVYVYIYIYEHITIIARLIGL